MSNLVQDLPFNIDLLILNAENHRQALANIKQIKVLDIFVPSSTNFHPDGLFSVEIFGKVGDEKRNETFGYIDLGIDILHPLIFRELGKLRELYTNIMAGKSYAVFNKELGDFEESTVTAGQTGYTFFMEHFQQLRPEERDSTSRRFAINFLNKYRKNAMLRYLLVMPAGLRDFTIEPNGKREEDEINTLYRQALSIGNIAISSSKVEDKTHLDTTRYRLQTVVYSIYQYVINLLEGDSKMIQGNWTSRNITTSTRNVITSSVMRSEELFDDLTVGPNDTVVGLYQHIRSIFPIFVHELRQYSEKVFVGPNAPANLIDKKTLAGVQVRVDPKHYDDWVTQDGIEGLLNQFEIEQLRFDTIEIEDHYFALLYRDQRQCRFFQDINLLPEGFDRKNVFPITFAELFTMAIYPSSRNEHCLTTRYPVISFGGIAPGEVYLRTTMRADALEVLGDDWKPSFKIREMPVKGQLFFNSMSIPIGRLPAADADHDGDMMNYEIAMTLESNEEIKKLLSSARYYVGLDGRMVFSAENDVSSLVFKELSA